MNLTYDSFARSNGSSYNGDMTVDHFDRTLRAFQRRTPFRPFTVELVGGHGFQVDESAALVLRGGVAVFIAADGTPTLFDHEGVSQLVGD